MKNRGFTIIELLVVISIMGLLSSILLVSVNEARTKARDARRLGDVRQMITAINLYYEQNNTYNGIGENELFGMDSSGSGSPFLPGLATAGIIGSPIRDIGNSSYTSYFWVYKDPYGPNGNIRFISCGNTPIEAEAVLLFWLEKGPLPGYKVGYGNGNAVCFY